MHALLYPGFGICWRWHARRRCVALALALAAGAPALGTPLPPLVDLALPSGSFQSSLGGATQMFGVPVDIRLIEVPLSVPNAVQALTQQYPELTDLAVLPGQAILSGDSGLGMWLVSLEAAGPQRTRGSVARLQTPDVASSQTLRPPSWLPRSARLQLDFQADDGGVRTRHQVWTLALTVQQARHHVAKGLRRQGWQSMSAAGNAEIWSRDAVVLDITYAALGEGSGLLLLQHEKGSP